jgi:sugar lactone lactonase YvrE
VQRRVERAEESVKNFHLALSELSFVGTDLSRPESVIATASGDVYTSDIRDGVTWIRPDGSQSLIGGSHLPERGLHPNGIALMKDGSFLFANSGTGDDGGVWRLHRSGQVEPFLLEVDGVKLPRTNFVHLDDADRLWICVSTVHRPNYEYSKDRADGFIILVYRRGARIVGAGIVGLTSAASMAKDPYGATFLRRSFG